MLSPMPSTQKRIARQKKNQENESQCQEEKQSFVEDSQKRGCNERARSTNDGEMGEDRDLGKVWGL